MTGMLLISVHIFDPLQKLQSFMKWDKQIDVNPEDKTYYTTQYQEAFLKYEENEYCAKHRYLLVTKPENILINTLISSAIPCRSGQSWYNPGDLSSDDVEYVMPNNVAETTPSRSNCAVRLLTGVRLYLNSPPELPQNWGQINPNLNYYLSYPMEISWTFWLPDITDWWRERKETYSKYADPSNMGGDKIFIIPHSVGVEPCVSLGQHVIGWRQLQTTGDSLCEIVIGRQLAQANNGLLAGGGPGFDRSSTENDMEMNREMEEKKLHRTAKVHNLLGMWQGSQNVWATQKESRTQNKQMTALRYISDTEEIVKATDSNFEHDVAAGFKLSEKSLVPPALSAMDLSGEGTQVLNVRWIKRIDHHPAEIDGGS